MFWALLHLFHSVLGPLHIIPVDRAGPVTGTNFALGSYGKFQPGFRDEKKPKILGTSSGVKYEKQSKNTQKSYNFSAYHSFGNEMEINGMLMICKIQQAKQDDAIRVAIIHPGNRADVFVWQNFQPDYPDPGWKN